MPTPALVVLLLAQSVPQAPPATPPTWHTSSCPHGVKVHIRQIADAPRTTVFSFLPVGLDGDPAGRAQFSHLAEHMLIRTTDPKPRLQGELQLNGETTAQGMRLESMGPPAKADEMLRRHARWLTTREFDADTLAREKVRIAGELRHTLAGGFNHKWATAAWSQLLAGRDHAAVHGDVAAATVAQVHEYVAAQIDLGKVRIFVTGPGKPEEQIAVLRDEFGKWKPTPAAKVNPAPIPPPAKAGTPPPATGDRDATWDLAASHYLEWYALPEGCNPAVAETLAQLVTSGMFSSRDLRDIPGRGMACIVRHGGRRFLLLSSNQPEGTETATLRKAFATAIGRVKALALWQAQPRILAARFSGVPDFTAQRERAPDRFAHLAEANWSLGWGYACLRLDTDAAGVPEAYREVSPKLVVDLAAGSCTPALRQSARLTERRPR